MKKMWGGRFSKKTDLLTDDFNSSISFDQRLYKQDITGSIAHARMLGKQNIIDPNEAELIIKTLETILIDIEAGNVEFSVSMEDIHMNVEAILTERIGDVGKKLHTGRSRNDQVATDMRLYVKEIADDCKSLIRNLILTLLDLADDHTNTIMPGYTHLQRAQPITFAHHLMAYVEMFKRDMIRMTQVKAMADTLPLGSGALATTTYPLDRSAVAAELDFAFVSLNSLDGVSDRDFCLDFLEAASVLMMHLSRFSEEIILWCSSEFNFITLDDAFSTGSSIMPQKKNPDIAELVRGKTGRVYGNLMGLLTTMKGIPLAYNKDMQEDKEPVFDTYDTIKICLITFAKMIKTLTVNKKTMKKAAAGGFSNATDAADWLVKHGIAFRDAHEIIGKLVFFALEQQKSLDELTLDEYRSISPVFDESIFSAIDLNVCVNQRNIIGGPAEEQVRKAIALNHQWLVQN
ncbi:argininosuccinate lyase [Acetobacterium wieringae]|uniref:Argininosuccinate lyase n=1 Tax=Acetobacterium wieringae TaxID=52694 RepID=A0ABY6HE79_9FIRM|nr:argininosuccinate lyase [Acetobacterium wieringae]UYO61774.1 argininosuccinate lyase [Acetobacterium wieringae]VUZ28116.1 Argininosuccinate lyase [Acetobacterium wieringae]